MRVCVCVYRCLMMVRGIFLLLLRLLDSLQNAIPFAQHIEGGLLLSIPSHTYETLLHAPPLYDHRNKLIKSSMPNILKGAKLYVKE